MALTAISPFEQNSQVSSDHPQKPELFGPGACPKRGVRPLRFGVSVAELLVAISIVAMVATATAALARAMQQAFEIMEAQGQVVQQARVCLERIVHTVSQARTSPQFPGFLVVTYSFDTFPIADTLVVWSPKGNAAEPEGLPRFNELVVYCPHPEHPNRLLEIRFPEDSRPVPPITDLSSWRQELQNLKQASDAQRVELSALMRTVTLTTGLVTKRQAGLWFFSRMRPSEEEWLQYMQGSRSWESLSWVQGMYGVHRGIRQHWLRIELQMLPPELASSSTGTREPLPFFGSVAIYYPVKRPSGGP